MNRTQTRPAPKAGKPPLQRPEPPPLLDREWSEAEREANTRRWASEYPMPELPVVDRVRAETLASWNVLGDDVRAALQRLDTAQQAAQAARRDLADFEATTSLPVLRSMDAEAAGDRLLTGDDDTGDDVSLVGRAVAHRVGLHSTARDLIEVANAGARSARITLDRVKFSVDDEVRARVDRIGPQLDHAVDEAIAAVLDGLADLGHGYLVFAQTIGRGNVTLPSAARVNQLMHGAVAEVRADLQRVVNS